MHRLNVSDPPKDDTSIYVKRRRGIFSSAMRRLRSLQDVNVYDLSDEEAGENSIMWRSADQWLPTSGRTEVETPKHLGEMFEDVLVYIFSFLNTREKLKASQTCKLWLQASRSDYLWEGEYKNARFQYVTKRIVTNNYRDAYLDDLREHRQAKAKHLTYSRKIDAVNRTQQVFRCSYGLVFPFFFFLGLLLTSISVPLLLDGIIDYDRYIFYTAIPFLTISFPAYLLTAFGVVLDPVLLNYFKRQYHQVLGRKRSWYGDTDMIKAVNLFVWSMSWLPFTIACVYMKLLVFPQAGYRICFLPVFLCCVLVIIVPPVVWLTKLFRRQSLTQDHSSFFVYTCLAVLNLFVVIQTGLIAARLDSPSWSLAKHLPNAVHAFDWGAIFTPIWILFSVILLGCPVACCSSIFGDSEFCGGMAYISCVSQCLILPLEVFMIMFTVLLDGAATFGFIHAFIPLFLFQALVLYCALCVGICSMGNFY